MNLEEDTQNNNIEEENKPKRINGNELDNGYISPYKLEVKTVQSNTINKLFEAVKGILIDTNLVFLPDGLRIIAVDVTCNILVHTKLYADKFEYYHCPKKVVVGMNMMNLFKIINTAGNDDTLTFIVDESESNRFQIKIENGDKNTKDIFKLNMIDIDYTPIEIPAVQFESVITLPTTDFQKYCRDMEHIGEKVEIRTTGKQLYMICETDCAEQKKSIGESDACLGFLKSSSDIMQGVFKLKYLVQFTKCTSLCNNVMIYLKNDYPLILKYAVSNMGEIKLCLTPCQDEEDENKNNDDGSVHTGNINI
jgi:proliferating cell nuclear antigen